MVDPEREVRRMHEAIEDWFVGDLDDLAPFAAVLAGEFRIVSPDGTTSTRDEVVAGMREAHGAHIDADPPFAVEVRDVERRDAAGDRYLVTYEEHQRVGGRWEARASSAWFRERADAPAGVEWLHLHETWLDGE